MFAIFVCETTDKVVNKKINETIKKVGDKKINETIKKVGDKVVDISKKTGKRIGYRCWPKVFVDFE